jgi:hypothetical protein
VPVDSDGKPATSGAPSSPRVTSSSSSSSSLVSVPVAVDRFHFHEFMLWTHEQLHQLQQSLPKVVTLSRAGLRVFR